LKENFDRFTHDNFKEKEMADFRKMLFVLAGLLIIIGTASAQTGVTCQAFVANQPTLRQEGATEPAGDILINCSGTLVGAQTGPQTLTLYVTNATITSRELWTGSTTPSSRPTEAAVLVNDCTSSSGTSATGFNCAPNGTFLGGTPTQGFIQNGALVFSGFTLPVVANGGQFQIRVTNVRVNANSLSAGSFVTGTVLATFGIQNQQNLVLGAVQSSLSVTVGSVSPFSQCTSTGTAGSVLTTLTVKELVNTAFKAPATCASVTTQCKALNSVPGQWYQNGVNSESQTVFTAPTGATGWTNQTNSTPGLADWGTRVRVNFSNIPAGVTISVPVSICGSFTTSSCTGSSSVLANATSGGDTGTFTVASGTAVSLTSSGSVTYEILNQNGSGIDTLDIPVTIVYTYTPPSTPNVGTILVSATYAPTTAEITTANVQPGVPRFADTSSLQSFITIAACQTDLLFTFMTNQAGFDTGFEISNTSTDPFGTAAQNGTCTLNWYGTGPAAGTATTTPSIASGSYYANLVSSAAPGFQGYMIAVCNFQFGHGFAFISDGYGQPGRGLSQGYLASVIPTPGLQPSSGGTANVRNASDASITAGKGTGEALNQ
jgi:hypothetical protein